MTQITKSQLHREAVELELWQSPCPKLDAATLARFAQFDSGNNDQAVGNNAVGDSSALPDLGPLNEFGTWDSVASTIMHKAESISGFDPGSPTFDPVAWRNFLTKFSTIPFYLQYVVDYRHASISSLSLDQSVNAVSDLLQNIMTPENFAGIVTSIKKMGTLALQNKGQTEKNNNQQVGVLSRHGNRLYLGVVRTEVSMTYKSGKGYEQLQQTLDIYRGYGVLDFDKCKRQASTLLAWDGKDVDEWAGGTDSASLPPNQSPAWGK